MTKIRQICNENVTYFFWKNVVKKYHNVFGTLGIHPEELDSISDSDFTFIEENINNPKNSWNR